MRLRLVPFAALLAFVILALATSASARPLLVCDPCDVGNREVGALERGLRMARRATRWRPEPARRGHGALLTR